MFGAHRSDVGSTTTTTTTSSMTSNESKNAEEPNQFFIDLYGKLTELNTETVDANIWSARNINIADQYYNLEEIILKIIEIVDKTNAINNEETCIHATIAISEVDSLCQKILKIKENDAVANKTSKRKSIEMVLDELDDASFTTTHSFSKEFSEKKESKGDWNEDFESLIRRISEINEYLKEPYVKAAKQAAKLSEKSSQKKDKGRLSANPVERDSMQNDLNKIDLSNLLAASEEVGMINPPDKSIYNTEK